MKRIETTKKLFYIFSTSPEARSILYTLNEKDAIIVNGKLLMVNGRIKSED